MQGEPLPQPNKVTSRRQLYEEALAGEAWAAAEIERLQFELAATLAELDGLRQQVTEARRIAKRLEAGGYRGAWVGRKPAPPLHTVYRYDVTALTDLVASRSLPGALKEEKDND